MDDNIQRAIERIAVTETEVEELRVWRAGHEGRNTAYWEEQHRWNKILGDRVDDAKERITNLEKRVIMLAALSAGAGGTLGGFAPGLLKMLLGG